MNDVLLAVKNLCGGRTVQPGCAMKLASLATMPAAFLGAASAWAQGPGPWQMHDWMGWGWGGIGALDRRWRQSGGRVRTAREILDERYARGEIDRDEYQRRRGDIGGRS